MKNIIFYSYSKCTTCKKAAKWLDQRDVEYQLIDIIKETPSVEYLELALLQYSDDIKKVFNTRGKSFKLIVEDIYKLSNQEIIQLLKCDGKLIKRPFLVCGGKKIVLGFNEIEYKKQTLQD